MALSKPTHRIFLLDAQAVIDLHAWSLWMRLTHSCQIALSSVIKQEVRFYKDQQGQKQPIQLETDISTQRIEILEVSSDKVASLVSILNPAFLPALDEGELEAIAFLYSLRPKEPYYFCTADGLAIKCLGALGLRHCSLSLEALFTLVKINHPLPPRYSKAYFDKMLQEGFRDSHLYQKHKV